MPEAPHNADPQIRYAVRSEFTGVSLRSMNPEAGGFSSCSRWLSTATPPDPVPFEIRTPEGVLAIACHALDPHLPSLPPHLRDKISGTDHRGPLACRTPFLSRRNRQRPRRTATGRRWCRGSRPSSRFPEIHPLPRGFYAGIEEILMLMDSRLPTAFFPMARGLRRFQRQRIGAGIGETIHRQSGRTSPGQILPRGVDRIPQKVWRGIRRTVSRLSFADAGGISSGSQWLSEATPPVSRRNGIRTPAWVPSDALQPAMLASLQDADSLTIHRPVVSLLPRSTTSYRMEYLRDDDASLFSLSK